MSIFRAFGTVDPYRRTLAALLAREIGRLSRKETEQARRAAMILGQIANGER